MRDYRAIRRETGLVEVLCEHGVGHPHPDSVAWLDEHGPPGAKGAWGSHGCDGCCSRPGFPKAGQFVPWAAPRLAGPQEGE